MSIINYDDFSIRVVKSDRRKTMALKIKDGEVSLHIPKRLAMTLAHSFVRQKYHWIQQKLGEHQSRPDQTRQFIEGEMFFYLGHKYPLTISSAGNKAILDFHESQFEFSSSPHKNTAKTIHTAFLKWYRQQANDHLTRRTAELAAKIDLTPKSITIKTYKARWGSCTSKGDIHYNWKIIQAPSRIIDYLIIHELCHLRHHNHSQAFWQLVEHHCYDYKAARLWLKNNGYTLEI